MLSSYGQSHQSLRKPEKVFLNYTNLHYAIGEHTAPNIDIGTIRELAFVQAAKSAGLAVSHDKSGDFFINQFVYESGGKNKTRKQIMEVMNAFLVKDDVIAASANMIPLLYFGMLY